MLLQLPTFNATLNSCPVNPATAFTPHAQGHFCGSCQRVVQDFSRSENPVTDLATARAASPDGRVCGSFRREQVQQSPTTLTRRLRWFIMALVLVVGQGLTAREALAQVRRPVLENLRTVAMPVRSEATTAPEQPEVEVSVQADEHQHLILGMMSMPPIPTFRGGDNRAMVAYIQKRVVWPQHNGKPVNDQGKVFASFTIGADGLVHNVRILKSFNPYFNEPVLCVIRGMKGFSPSRENGRPVATTMVLPVTFTLK